MYKAKLIFWNLAYLASAMLFLNVVFWLILLFLDIPDGWSWFLFILFLLGLCATAGMVVLSCKMLNRLETKGKGERNG